MNETKRCSLYLEVLKDAERAFSKGDIDKVIKIIFVWSQRQDHLLNEEETWRDQRI